METFPKGGSLLVVQLSNQIFLENDSPRDTSIAAIAYWVRSNVPKLNLLLYENFQVDYQGGTYEVIKQGCTDYNKGFNDLAAQIMVSMFKVYRLELDIRKIMMGIFDNNVIIAKDQEFSITRINKSEVLKTLTAFKKDVLAELNMMVHYYRSFNNGNGTVSQVAGDDTVPGYFRGDDTWYVRNDFNGI